MALTLSSLNLAQSAGVTIPLCIKANDPLPSPQWGLGGAMSSAFIGPGTVGATITFKATFHRSGDDPTSFKVSASDSDAASAGSLGATSAPVDVVFPDPTTTSLTVDMPLIDNRLWEAGVHVYDRILIWTLAGSPPTVFAQSEHRVYVTLAAPQLPWGDSKNAYVFGGMARLNASTNPEVWTALLDWSCGWAKGATTVEAATSSITQRVNQATQFIYDNNRHFINDRDFALASNGNISLECCNVSNFLTALMSGVVHTVKINCVDCAAIVTSFATAIGCQVHAITINNKNQDGFPVNQLMLIGKEFWSLPNSELGAITGFFGSHDVVVTGANTPVVIPPLTTEIFDACLQVDGGPDPWALVSLGNPKTPHLPVAMTYLETTATTYAVPYSVMDYLPRLLADPNQDAKPANLNDMVKFIAPVQGTLYGCRPVI